MSDSPTKLKRMLAVHVVDRKLGIDYGFMYQIRTPDELLAYWDEVAQPRWSAGFGDFLATASHSHASTNEGSLIRVFYDVTGEAPLLILGKFADRSYQAMASTLDRCPIVINRNGGFFPLTDQEIVESREVDTWTLPGAKLKISQWPNGKHFYAKIGDESVEWVGRNKWDTRESAERAAANFAKEKRIVLEPTTEHG